MLWDLGFSSVCAVLYAAFITTEHTSVHREIQRIFALPQVGNAPYGNK
jgi:hypothetical protein